MGWVGVLTGGALGGMLGGPWGVALGALIGHWAENKLGAQSQGAASAAEERQALFVVAIFSCLAKLAKADGVVDRSEAAYIRTFIDRNFAAVEREAIRNIFNAARDNDVPFQCYVDRMAEAAPDPGIHTIWGIQTAVAGRRRWSSIRTASTALAFPAGILREMKAAMERQRNS